MRENGETLSSIEGVDAPDRAPRDRARARGEPGERYFSEATVADVHVRVLTFAFGPGYAVQIARSLTEVDDTLAQIRLYLLLIAGGRDRPGGGARAPRLGRRARARCGG